GHVAWSWRPAMILDCRACGDPLFDHMERCEKCGAENPSFTPREPPRHSVFTTDSGTEFGVLLLGVMGPVVGSATFIAPNPQYGRLPAGAAGFCVVLGLLCFAAYHWLDVSALKPSTKLVLRGFMLVLSLLFAAVWTTLRLD